jgi:ceramide glucosyltransferase
MTATALMTSFVLCAAVAQFVSIALVLIRARLVAARRPAWRPPVTILRPICGIEDHIHSTLASAFAISYPQFEIIFCVASPDDPVVPIVEQLIAAHPEIPSRLLVGEHRISANPKLNNLVKGWRAARHEFIAMADSNILLPVDYLDQLMAHWQSPTDLVSSPAFGGQPDGIGAELECAFLNSYQARWQFAAAAMGAGYAQGKTLFWRRDVLDHAGGIGALASEPAEDAAATKLVRQAGGKVRLVTKPFEQPLGHRRFTAIWQRQIRWARLRRDTFGGLFALEILSGGFFPLTVAAGLAVAGDGIAWTIFAGLLIAWYGAEMLLARIFSWPLSWRTPLILVARDLILPALWFAAWAGNTVVWRNTTINLRTADENGLARLV